MSQAQTKDRAWVQARYWTPGAGLAVTCLLCPHHCHIQAGESGRCQVRTNVAGRLMATAYGHVTALALDPIEKKPLAAFKPGTRILSLGSYGCNLRCAFCQNWTLSQQKAAYRTWTADRLVDQALSLQAAGNIGLAHTYNEPLIHYEFVLACAKATRKAGLDTVLVTNGFINPEPLDELLPWVDAMNIDLKAWTEAFYRSVCAGNLKAVRQTIERAVKSCHVECTCLLIPGLNDGEEEIDQMAAWLASLQSDLVLHLSRHHPDYLMPKPAPISLSRLDKLANIARKHLHRVQLGNVF